MPGITLYGDHVSKRGGHNTPWFTTWLHFVGDSTKAFFRGCAPSHNYRNKYCPVPDTNVVSSEDSQQVAQDTTARITKFDLTPKTEPTGCVSAIELFYIICLHPKKFSMSDSGVILRPDEQLNDHKHTSNMLATNVKQARPHAHYYLRTGAAYFGPPAQTVTALSMVSAAHLVGQRKIQSGPRLHLSDVALYVLATRVVSLRRHIPRIRDCKHPLTPIQALVLCILSKYSDTPIVSYKGVWDLLAEVTLLRHTTLSLPFGSSTVLLDDHSTRLQLPACGDVADLDDTCPRREHAPSHGKSPASTVQKRHMTSGEPRRKGRKRPCPSGGGRSNKGNYDSEDDDDDGDERRTSQPHPGESLLDQDGRLFGCPFYKHDPFTHRFCLFRQSLTGTNYVRQHLRRYHLQPMHCPTCGSVFELQSALDGHIRERTCQIQKVSHPGLTQVQREALEKNMSRKCPPEERWYKMWEIIFPDAPRPASPYLKDPWIEVVENNFDMWTEQGGPGRMDAKGGPTRSRPEPAVRGQEQDGTTSPTEMWEIVKQDMIESADQRIHPRTDLEIQAATNQQPEQQSLSDSLSSYEIVSPYNSGLSTQVQPGPASISVPRRGPGYSSDYLAPVYIPDPDYYVPPLPGSTGGLQTLGGAGGSTSCGTRYGPRLPSQYQQFSDAYPAMSVNQSFNHAYQGSDVLEAYGTTPTLDPAFHAQLSRQTPRMTRSFPHNHVPEQELLSGMGGNSGDMPENVEGTVPGTSQGGTLGGGPGQGGADDEGFDGLGF